MSTGTEEATSQPQLIEVTDEVSGLHGYLAIYSVRSGLSFGGLRISPTVTPEIVTQLARSMHLKYAGHSLAVGGTKGGIISSPDHPQMLDRIAAFGRKLGDMLTSSAIVGKDMGASNELLDHLYGALDMPQLGVVQKRFGQKTPDRIRDLGGYHVGMTGRGVTRAVVAACEHIGLSLSGARVALQGMGVVSRGAIRYLSDRGARIVAVSDRDGMVSKPGGLPADTLLAATSAGGIVDRNALTGALTGHRDQLLGAGADVLILAADSFTVTTELAETIEAKLIVEGANLAIFEDARDALYRAGTIIVPDVIASSSSAALLGHQFLAGNTMTDEEVWRRIEDCIAENSRLVIDLGKRGAMDGRRAFIDGIDRGEIGG